MAVFGDPAPLSSVQIRTLQIRTSQTMTTLLTSAKYGDIIVFSIISMIQMQMRVFKIKPIFKI